MLQEQKLVLDEYMQLMAKPTFREMAKDTGIQLTRLFRIMNGMEMRLNEYVLLKRRVEELTDTSRLSQLAFKCESTLPSKARKELEGMMMRLLKQQELLAA